MFTSSLTSSLTPASATSRHRPDLIGRSRAGVLATALAVAASSVIVAATPAQAAATRHDGVVKMSRALNCDGVTWGSPYYEYSAASVASVIYDDAVPLRAGDVFYVSVETTAVGKPYPCVSQKMRPDLTLPSGVSLAVSAANPIRCVKWDYTVDPYTGTPETALCPQAPQAAESGGTIGFGTAGGEMWTIPTGIGYEVQVPVVVAEPGIKTFTFPVRIVDGNSNPILSPVSDVVEIVAGAATTPTPIPTPLPDPTPEVSISTDVDRVVRLARTHGTVPVEVTVNRAASRVRLKLVVRWRGRSVVVATRKLTPTAVGVTRTRVKLDREWRARLRGQRVSAVLTSRAAADGSSDRAAETLIVKG